MRLLIVIGAAVLAAGCTETPSAAPPQTNTLPPATTTTTTTTTPTPPPGSTPEETWCQYDVPHNAAGPAYTGPAPHPAVVAELHSKSDLTTVLSPGAPALPPEWQAADPNLVQLVVCAFMPNLDHGAETGVCDYVDQQTQAPRTVRIVTADYGFTVREARTGNEIGAFNLPGTVNHCPASLLTLRDSQALGQRVSDQQFAEALRQFVEAAR